MSKQSPRVELIRAILLFALAAAVIPSVVDVDLWGHLRFGSDIVRTHAVPSGDPYSFTADRKWINHEWLSEVAMYGAYRGFGVAGLTGLRLATIAALLALAGDVLRKSGVSGRRQFILLAFLAVLTYPRTEHVRPQLFSLPLFAALLWTVVESRRRPAILCVAPVLFAIWSNLHGGWIVGLGVLTLWVALSLITPSTSRERAWGMAALAASLVATLANPYSIELWRFLWSTVGLSRPDIIEWRPIFSAPPAVIGFWVVTAALALAVVARGMKSGISRREAILVLTMGLLSARVARLDAFFVITTLMLLAPQLAMASASSQDLAANRGLRPVMAVCAVACALAVRWPAINSMDLASVPWLPQRGAVDFMQANGLRGNMMTYFNWGEYAIWHLPSLKVSMDGRRETVYTPETIANHLAVYNNEPLALDYVRRLDPDYVWLPRRLPVVASLRSSEGWKTIYEDDTSSLLAKHDVGRGTPGRHDSVVRYFPGP